MRDGMVLSSGACQSCCQAPAATPRRRLGIPRSPLWFASFLVLSPERMSASRTRARRAAEEGADWAEQRSRRAHRRRRAGAPSSTVRSAAAEIAGRTSPASPSFRMFLRRPPSPPHQARLKDRKCAPPAAFQFNFVKIGNKSDHPKKLTLWGGREEMADV